MSDTNSQSKQEIGTISQEHGKRLQTAGAISVKDGANLVLQILQQTEDPNNELKKCICKDCSKAIWMQMYASNPDLTMEQSINSQTIRTQKRNLITRCICSETRLPTFESVKATTIPTIMNCSIME